MDIFLLYLWTRLDAIQLILVLVSIAGLLALIYTVLTWAIPSYDQDAKEFGVLSRKIAKYLSIPVIVLVLIPSQKDATIIAGGWAAKQIATSGEAKQISAKTLALINGKLDVELMNLESSKKISKALQEDIQKTEKLEEVANRMENLDKAIAAGTLDQELREINQLIDQVEK